MNNLHRWLVALCAALLVPAVASAAADMFLKISGVKGEARIVKVQNGVCKVEGLAPGKYSVLVCDAAGKVLATEASLQYAVVSPRDSQSGLATGKRQHKPLKITKEVGTASATTNQIAIDEPGVHVTISVISAAPTPAATINTSRSNIKNN